MRNKTMRKKSFQYFLFSASFFVLFAAPNIQAETLQQAVQYMVQTNPDIKTVVHNRLARDQELNQARSGYWPKIDANAGVGFTDYSKPINSNHGTEEYTLSFRQNLYNGLATINEERRQKARINSAAYRLRSVADNVTLRASEVYCDVLRYTELYELAKENLKIHERLTDQITLRSESGVSNMADIDQVSARLALAHSNVFVASTNLEDAKSNYFSVIGKMPEDLVKPEIAENLIPATLDEALQLAKENHPTLKSSIADLEARKMQHEVAKSPYLPIVDIEVDKRWRNNTDYDPLWEESLVAMVRVRYTLFNGWKDKARRFETHQLAKEAQEISNHTNRQVIEGLRLSWMAYKAVTDRKKYLQQRVEAISKTSQAFSKQWNIGQRTLFDVLDTEAEAIDAKQNLIDVEYDGLYAQFRILNSMGSLVNTFGVQLPEAAKPLND